MIRTAGRALLIQDGQVLAVKYRGDGIEWLPIADLSRYCLYPLDMRELLQHWVTGRANSRVYLGSGA